MKPNTSTVTFLTILGMVGGHLKAETVQESFEELVADFEKAVLTLENRNGGENLRTSYQKRLEALIGDITEESQKKSIREEISKIESVYPIDRDGSSTFPELARIQEIFDDKLIEIRRDIEAPHLKLKGNLKAQLEANLQQATAEDKKAWLSLIELKFPELLEEPSSTQKERTLFRFSVLQEQLTPPKPKLKLAQFATKAEFEKWNDSLPSEGEEGNADTIGTTVSAEADRLKAPGISRTLLIYSKDSDQERAVGSLLLRNEATLEVSEPSETLRFQFPGPARFVPTIPDGDMIILQKDPDFDSVFEIKAGPSTIAVRGTKAFVIPKTGNVFEERAPRNSRQHEATLLVMDGTVTVNNEEIINPERRTVKVGDKGLLSLNSLVSIPSFFEKTEYAAAYRNHLKYYPTSNSWLLADFGADNRFGPLVHGSGSGSGKIGDGLILSFPPIDTSYYRYLEVSFTIRRKATGAISLLWGNPEVGDDNTLHYYLSGDQLGSNDPGEGYSVTKRVLIDLWGKDSQHLRDLPPTITAFTICDHGLAASVGNLVLRPEAKNIDGAIIQPKPFRSPPLVQSKSTFSNQIAVTGITEQLFFFELTKHLLGNTKVLDIGKHSSESSLLGREPFLSILRAERNARLAVKEITASESLMATAIGCRRAIDSGVDAILIEMDKKLVTDFLRIESTSGANAALYYLAQKEVEEKHGISYEEISRAMGPANTSRERRERNESLRIVHQCVLRALYPVINPEKKPVVIQSYIYDDTRRIPRDERLPSVLSLSPEGKVTRVDGP